MSHKVTTIITSDKAVANNDLRLSICLSADGFSFSVTTFQDEIVMYGEAVVELNLALEALSQAVKDCFAQVGVSTFGFRQARLVIPTEQFVWIPDHLHESVRDRQYLRMVAHVDISMGVYHIAVPYLHSMMVFAAPASVVTAFKLAIPGIDVHCQHSVLACDQMLQKSIHHPVVLMHVRAGVGDYEAFFNGQLLLSNSYSIQNKEELLYHAIELMKQLHLETPDMELAICGNVDREFYAHLQHYFPNVTLFTGRPISYSNPEFRSLPTYKHVMLLS